MEESTWLGICAALLEAKTSGEGQVVDAAMTEGAASLMASIYGMHASGHWSDQREDNVLDGVPITTGFMRLDGKFVSIGSIEGKFHDELLELTGLQGASTEERNDQSSWSEKKDRMAEVIKSKTRDEWDEIMLGSDVCYAPVLDLTEAPSHPHNAARGSLLRWMEWSNLPLPLGSAELLAKYRCHRHLRVNTRPKF